MKFLVCASLAASTVSSTATPPNKRMMFEHFIAEYKRSYATEAEKAMRFEIFSHNVDFMHSSNSQNKTYTLGITEHADWSFEEWRAKYIGGFKPQSNLEEKRSSFAVPAGFAEPDSVDWVASGGVTSVKDQGQCGSCWTFSTVGALEGAMHVSGRNMVDLSMQHILACDHGGNGCGGGLMDQAFGWVKENGVTSLKDEPYLCADPNAEGCANMQCGACKKETGSHCFLSDCTVGVCTGLVDKVCQCPDDQCFADGQCGPPQPGPPLVLKAGDVAGFTDVPSTEMGLEAAVAQQPVSVAIEADTSVFQHYTGGILTSDACGETLDHGVLAVGYGVEKGQKYWKVKNSWGASWGDHGYIRIAKGVSGDGGECGIRRGASFPTIKKAASDIIV